MVLQLLQTRGQAAEVHTYQKCAPREPPHVAIGYNKIDVIVQIHARA